MQVNIVKELKVEENDAHKNGFVGYDEDSIYRVLPGDDASAYQDKNGSRVKDIFDNDFTSTSSKELAFRLHEGKSELSSLGNFFGIIAEIESTSLVSRVSNKVLGLPRKILADDTKLANQEFGLEVGADDAFNPDFPANSVSYTYSEPRVRTPDNKDKVDSRNKAPNVVFPNNEDVGEYVAPFKSSTSNGGFGNSESANSIGEDRLDSLRITTKY